METTRFFFGELRDSFLASLNRGPFVRMCVRVCVWKVERLYLGDRCFWLKGYFNYENAVAAESEFVESPSRISVTSKSKSMNFFVSNVSSSISPIFEGKENLFFSILNTQAWPDVFRLLEWLEKSLSSVMTIDFNFLSFYYRVFLVKKTKTLLIISLSFQNGNNF